MAVVAAHLTAGVILVVTVYSVRYSGIVVLGVVYSFPLPPPSGISALS